MIREIAICGMAPSRKHMPLIDGELWGLPWDPLAHRYDRLFDMHARELIERRGKAYVEFLQTEDRPIYMQEEFEDIPNALRYPLGMIREYVTKRDYFQSSIAYMLALAIHQSPLKISLWGVECATNDEWAYERPCNEFLLGIATARQIEIEVQSPSSILSHQKEVRYLAETVEYPTRYGYL